jgi:hypothetical protein
VDVAAVKWFRHWDVKKGEVNNEMGNGHRPDKMLPVSRVCSGLQGRAFFTVAGGLGKADRQ